MSREPPKVVPSHRPLGRKMRVAGDPETHPGLHDCHNESCSVFHLVISGGLVELGRWFSCTMLTGLEDLNQAL